MTQNAMKLWARRAMPAGTTLYRLRDTHASACHYAGLTIPEAARRLGHGPGLHVETYAHVIDAMSGTRHDGLDALITAARAELGFPQGSPLERLGSRVAHRSGRRASCRHCPRASADMRSPLAVRRASVGPVLAALRYAFSLTEPGSTTYRIQPGAIRNVS
jgi:hypothetical protein